MDVNGDVGMNATATVRVNVNVKVKVEVTDAGPIATPTLHHV